MESLSLCYFQSPTRHLNAQSFESELEKLPFLPKLKHLSISSANLILNIQNLWEKLPLLERLETRQCICVPMAPLATHYSQLQSLSLGTVSVFHLPTLLSRNSQLTTLHLNALVPDRMHKKLLCSLPSLRTLSLTDHSLEDFVSAAPNLVSLHLLFTSNFLHEPFSLTLPNLRTLSYQSSSPQLRTLHGPQLREVTLTVNVSSYPRLLESLQNNSPHLHTLDITVLPSKTSTVDFSLSETTWKHLTNLTLTGENICMGQSSSLSLRELTLGKVQTNTQNWNFPMLQRMSLEELDHSSWRLSGTSLLKSDLSCSQLTSLVLFQCIVDDNLLTQITRNSPYLRLLHVVLAKETSCISAPILWGTSLTDVNFLTPVPLYLTFPETTSLQSLVVDMLPNDRSDWESTLSSNPVDSLLPAIQQNPHLRKLVITGLPWMNDDAVQVISSFLPRLKTLSLQRSTNLKHLHITSSSLQKIDVNFCSQLQTVEIDCPSLVDLHSIGCDSWEKITLFRTHPLLVLPSIPMTKMAPASE